MPRTLSRSALDAALPPGNLWKPEVDEGFDQQLDGITDSTEDALLTVDSLADIRNPSRTPVFEDLERNYGIKPNENVTDAIRIARLKQRVYQGAKVNSAEDLETELITAGFDLQVHKNDPPVDPATFLTQSFQITAGSDYAYAGFFLVADVLAFAASLGGELLVNTPLTLQSNAYEMQAGGDIAYSGYTDGVDVLSVSGYFTGLRQDVLTYSVPTDPDEWSGMFFVGGDATRNAAGELTAIENGLVDSNRADDLKALILSDKSQGIWCCLMINYV